VTVLPQHTSFISYAISQSVLFRFCSFFVNSTRHYCETQPLWLSVHKSACHAHSPRWQGQTLYQTVSVSRNAFKHKKKDTDIRWCPSHHWILPSITRIELNLPLVGAKCSWLHGILCRWENAHCAWFQLLFGCEGYYRNIVLKHKHSAAQHDTLMLLVTCAYSCITHTGCLTDQQVWFPGVSRWRFDENSVQLEVLETVNFNLNEEACGDRSHLMPITVSSNT